MKTKPIKVTWSKDEELQCAILGGLGFSTKMIMNKTGLTFCQVNYRLNKGRIKRAHYRNGTSDVATMILNRTRLTDQAIRDLLELKIVK